MRAHVLDESGLIVNTVMVEHIGDGQVEADAYGGGIGDSIVNGVLHKAALVAQVMPTFEQQKAEYFVEVRETRERILNRLSGIMAAAIAAEPPEQILVRSIFLTLRQGLLDITSTASVEAATTIGDLRNAVRNEYTQLVGLAVAQSPDLVKAFREVDE